MELLITGLRELPPPARGFEFAQNGTRRRIMAGGPQDDAYRAICELADYVRAELAARSLGLMEPAPEPPPLPRQPRAEATRSILSTLFRRGVTSEPMPESKSPPLEYTPDGRLKSSEPALTFEQLRASRYYRFNPPRSGPPTKITYPHKDPPPGSRWEPRPSVLPAGFDKVRITEEVARAGFVGSPNLDLDPNDLHFASLLARIATPPSAPKAPPPARMGPRESLVAYRQELAAKKEQLQTRRKALELERSAIGLKVMMATSLTEAPAGSPMSLSELPVAGEVWPSLDKYRVELVDGQFRVAAQRDGRLATGETQDPAHAIEARQLIADMADLENQAVVVTYGLSRREARANEACERIREKAAAMLANCNERTVRWGQALASEAEMEPSQEREFAQVADRGRLIQAKGPDGEPIELYLDGETAVRSTVRKDGSIVYEKTTAGRWTGPLTQYMADVDRKAPAVKNPEPAAKAPKSACADFAVAEAAAQARAAAKLKADAEKAESLAGIAKWAVGVAPFNQLSELPPETAKAIREAGEGWRRIASDVLTAAGHKVDVFFDGRSFVARGLVDGREVVALSSDRARRAEAEMALKPPSAEQKKADVEFAQQWAAAKRAFELRQEEMLREYEQREATQADDLAWTAVTLAGKLLADTREGASAGVMSPEFARFMDQARVLAVAGPGERVLFDGKRFGVERAGTAGQLVDNPEMVAAAREYFGMAALEAPAKPATEPVREATAPDGMTRHFAHVRQGGPASRGDVIELVDSEGKHLDTLTGTGEVWAKLVEAIRANAGTQVTVAQDPETGALTIVQVSQPSKPTIDLQQGPVEPGADPIQVEIDLLLNASGPDVADEAKAGSNDQSPPPVNNSSDTAHWMEEPQDDRPPLTPEELARLDEEYRGTPVIDEPAPQGPDR